MSDILRKASIGLDMMEVDNKLRAELARLRKRCEVLEQVGTKIMKMWFHVEAFDDGDRGWKELGDELEQALKESKDE